MENITAKIIKLSQLKRSADFKIKRQTMKTDIKNDCLKETLTKLNIISSLEKEKRIKNPTIAKLPIKDAAREE